MSLQTLNEDYQLELMQRQQKSVKPNPIRSAFQRLSINRVGSVFNKGSPFPDHESLEQVLVGLD